MKYGVFSDVHGNLEALDAVLHALRQESAERIWCLGDLVGYGANPNECVDRIREAADAVVLGNHDAACIGAESSEGFNPHARAAVEWTGRQLSEANRAWIRGLPLTESIEDNLLVHASPFEPERWHYIHARTRPPDVERGFAATTARCAFVGHSHQQLVLVKRGAEFYRFLGTQLQLEEGHRYLVNVGSAGQPRDGDARAAYVLYDTVKETITLARVAYDVATAQRKIRDAGLPAFLADRLESGS